MIRWSSFLIIAIIFISCTIDRDKKVDREKLLFKTGDDTELFFKNVRASDYEKEEKKETRWEIYRHEDLYEEDDSLSINVAIIINILNDEAYIMVEPGHKVKEMEEVIVYATDPAANSLDTISFDHPNKEGMLEFASQLYEAIRDKKKLMLLYQQDTVPVLEDQERREAFRRTMADYYRLVRAF
ncbi:MAG: hypothetical protein ACNS60_04015 [Candidatus Cyclobacteriaceae bacterium M2_1C_046]